MSLNAARGYLPALMSFYASVLLAGCGAEPEQKYASTAEQALGAPAASSFSVSYRIYRTRSGAARKFDDLIPTSWFRDIERQNEQDYHIEFSSPAPGEPQAIRLAIVKWPTQNEDDLAIELGFRIATQELVPGKFFTCSFGTSTAQSACTLSGDITSTLRRERLFLPSGIKRPPLLCRLKIGEASFALSSDTLASKSLRLPPSPGMPETREKLSLAFTCKDLKNHLVALKGHFLQNTDEMPDLEMDTP